MDGVFYWPRLYGVMPDATRATLVEPRGAIDTMLTLSLLAWLYVPVAAAILAATGRAGTRGRGGLARSTAGCWSAWRPIAAR